MRYTCHELHGETPFYVSSALHETYIDTVISVGCQLQETSYSQFTLIEIALWVMRKIIIPSRYPLEHEDKDSKGRQQARMVRGSAKGFPG